MCKLYRDHYKTLKDMEEKNQGLGIHCSHIERINIVEVYSISLQINKHGHEVQFQIKFFVFFNSSGKTGSNISMKHENSLNL